MIRNDAASRRWRRLFPVVFARETVMVDACRYCLIDLAGTAYWTGKGFQPDPACERIVRFRSRRAAREEARRLARRGIWVIWVPCVTCLSTTSLTAGGTTLVITASAFSGAAAVCFGAVAAAGFTVLSDTAIVVTLPPEPSGKRSCRFSCGVCP